MIHHVMFDSFVHYCILTLSVMEPHDVVQAGPQTPQKYDHHHT